MTNRVSLSFSRVSVSDNDGRRIVQPVGELDVVTRDELVSACVEIPESIVVLDLSGLTFMDSCGYGGLVDARRRFEANGGSLTMENSAGHSARYLDMLRDLEKGDERP